LPKELILEVYEYEKILYFSETTIITYKNNKESKLKAKNLYPDIHALIAAMNELNIQQATIIAYD